MSISKKTFCSALCACALALSTSALAAPAPTKAPENAKLTSALSPRALAFAVPYKVVLNQSNARAFAQNSVNIVDMAGQKTLFLALPANATQVQLHFPDGDASLVAWQEQQGLPLTTHSAHEAERLQTEKMLASLQATLNGLHAQYNALYEPALLLKPAEAQAAMAKALPQLNKLSLRIEEVNKEMELTKNHLASLGKAVQASKKLTIAIESKKAIGSALRLTYSYTLNDSQWQPMYTISADSKANTVNFKLMARITQKSAMDWNNTEVEFSTMQGNEQAPPAVQPWVVSKVEKQARTYNMPANGMMLSKSASMDESMGAFNPDSAVATWTLNKKIRIPQGQTTLVLQEETLKAPLERIARPSGYNGTKVWLSAKHALISPFLPMGQATYLLDNVPVGESPLVVKDEQMQFFFGVDPLVYVDVKKALRKSDEDGIINKERIFTWNWTYTVINKRAQAVQVRLEEPETQLSDKAMTVQYTDQPTASKGPNETLVWDITVPAKGQSVVKRSVTVKAPKDMPIYPGR